MKRAWLALLASVAGCAGGTPIHDEASQLAWRDSLDAWHEARLAEARVLQKTDPEAGDRAILEMTDVHATLPLVQVHAVLKNVRTETPVLKLDKAPASGAGLRLLIESGPPGGLFTVYSALDLALPQAIKGEADEYDSFWVLPRAAQKKEVTGTFDLFGRARVIVEAPSAPFVVFQATIRIGDEEDASRSCTNPVALRRTE